MKYKYDVRNVMTMPTMQYQGFSGNLYKEDRLIAFFCNKTFGTATEYDFTNEEEEKELLSYIAENVKSIVFNKEHFEPVPLDIFVAVLVENYEKDKYAKNLTLSKKISKINDELELLKIEESNVQKDVKAHMNEIGKEVPINLTRRWSFIAGKLKGLEGALEILKNELFS